MQETGSTPPEISGYGRRSPFLRGKRVRASFEGAGDGWITPPTPFLRSEGDTPQVFSLLV
jgi:hypothetical protein